MPQMLETSVLLKLLNNPFSLRTHGGHALNGSWEGNKYLQDNI